MNNRNAQKSKKRIHTPEEIGMWQCCGEWHARAARCRKCGNTRPGAGGVSAGAKIAVTQRPADKTLDIPNEVKAAVPRRPEKLHIRLTRFFSGGKPLDNDNLLGSLKALRDVITADLLGLADDSEASGLEWEYRQAPGKGVLIEVFKKD